MHHSNIIKELMIIKDISLVEMTRRLNLKSHTVILGRLQGKDTTFENLIEILDELDYELIIRRKREGNPPDGEYVLRRADYEESEGEQ